MQQGPLLIDEEVFNKYEVSGVIQTDKLPALYKNYASLHDDDYYYLKDLYMRYPVKDHDVYVFHSEYYMAVSGEWVRLNVLPRIEEADS